MNNNPSSLFRTGFRRLPSPGVAVLAMLALMLLPGHAHADTDYIYYSSHRNLDYFASPDYSDSNIDYRYDRNTGEWDSNLDHDGNWTTLEEAPEVDSDDICWGQNWELSTNYVEEPGYMGPVEVPYYEAHDTVTGDWWLYMDYTYVWYPYSDPEAATDYTYCYNSDYQFYLRYDSLNGVWAQNGDDTGDWFYPNDWQDGADYYLGGDNWDISYEDGNYYAYDSIIDQWYVDDGVMDFNEDYIDVWSLSDGPE